MPVKLQIRRVPRVLRIFPIFKQVDFNYIANRYLSLCLQKTPLSKLDPTAFLELAELLSDLHRLAEADLDQAKLADAFNLSRRILDHYLR